MKKELDDYLTAWNLSDAQLLTQTGTSRIYTVTLNGERVILKLLSATETEEQRGAVALRCFNGQGAVRLLHHDDGAQLVEYAAGEELVTLVKRGEDEHAVRIIASLLNQLHSVPQNVPLHGLLKLEDWFTSLFNKASADEEAGINSMYVRSAHLTSRLLAEPRDVRVLHGDIHHYNIRQSPRGWLAFDPKGLLGERTYDCANTLCNPVITELVHNETRLLTNAAILADMLALDTVRILSFTYAYACLNASQWLPHIGKNDMAGEIIQWHLNVAAIIEPHLHR